MSNNTSAITRLYAWSVIMEPLLYFTVPLLGQTPGISRILQGILLGILALALIDGKSLPRPRFTLLFVCFYLLAVVALVVSVLRGSFPIEAGGAAIGTTSLHNTRMSISPLVNGLLEYSIAAYYYVYFVVFPQFFLRERSDINYFVSRFTFALLLTLVVGYADYFLTSFDHYYLTKNIFNNTNVGNRFHGFAGEPRHAVVFLIVGLAMLYVRQLYSGKRVSVIWVVSIFLAVLATKSFSGIVGIGLFVVMYGFYSVFILRSPKLAFMYIVSAAVVLIPVGYAALHDERVSKYTNQLPYVWSSLETGKPLPHPFSVQGRTIYPLYDLVVKARDLDAFPVLFGSGFGSASVTSNIYTDNGYLVLNPSSQFVRVVYEAGLVGFCLFVAVFLWPVYRLTRGLPVKQKQHLMMMSLLVLAAGLSQRHVGLYIYFGVFIAIMINYWSGENAQKEIRVSSALLPLKSKL